MIHLFRSHTNHNIVKIAIHKNIVLDFAVRRREASTGILSHSPVWMWECVCVLCLSSSYSTNQWQFYITIHTIVLNRFKHRSEHNRFLQLSSLWVKSPHIVKIPVLFFHSKKIVYRVTILLVHFIVCCALYFGLDTVRASTLYDCVVHCTLDLIPFRHRLCSIVLHRVKENRVIYNECSRHRVVEWTNWTDQFFQNAKWTFDLRERHIIQFWKNIRCASNKIVFHVEN